MVTLRVRGERVSLRGGVWTGASDTLLPDLEAIAHYATRVRETEGYVPDTDLVIARALVELLGAKILSYKAPQIPKGTVA